MTRRLQGFRLGDACWGVQFHPEVTEPQLDRWMTDKTDLPPDPERLERETREQIGTLERARPAALPRLPHGGGTADRRPRRLTLTRTSGAARMPYPRSFGGGL